MVEGKKAAYTIDVFELLDFIRPFESADEQYLGMNSQKLCLGMIKGTEFAAVLQKRILRDVPPETLVVLNFENIIADCAFFVWGLLQVKASLCSRNAFLVTKLSMDTEISLEGAALHLAHSFGWKASIGVEVKGKIGVQIYGAFEHTTKLVYTMFSTNNEWTAKELAPYFHGMTSNSAGNQLRRLYEFGHILRKKPTPIASGNPWVYWLPYRDRPAWE